MQGFLICLVITVGAYIWYDDWRDCYYRNCERIFRMLIAGGLITAAWTIYLVSWWAS